MSEKVEDVVIVAGVVAVLVALGAIASPWWALLVLGLCLIGAVLYRRLAR